ncbi:MAG TPA: hypothetical protein PLG34_13630 [Spirochaetota bacterium]|nr:hypothetical protein [Spirochaetota bacterium]
MENTAKMITDYGFSILFLALILFLMIRYLPRIIELRIKRWEEKDYMIDVLKKTIDNSTKVIGSNSIVIENNSRVIDNNSQAMISFKEASTSLEKEVKCLVISNSKSDFKMDQLMGAIDEIKGDKL